MTKREARRQIIKNFLENNPDIDFQDMWLLDWLMEYGHQIAGLLSPIKGELAELESTEEQLDMFENK